MQKRKQLTSKISIFMSKDKPCILKKRLNGVFDQNAGLIIQRFPKYTVSSTASNHSLEVSSPGTSTAR